LIFAKRADGSSSRAVRHKSAPVIPWEFAQYSPELIQVVGISKIHPHAELLRTVIAGHLWRLDSMTIPNKGAGRARSKQAPGQIGQQTQANLSGAPRAKPIRILVVDDHPIVRQGLRSFLADYRTLLVVGDAGNGKDAVTKARALKPDVVLMDIDIPKLGGLAATEVLVRDNPNCKVLILSLHKDSPYASAIIRAGAQGYISKESSPGELVKAIETVAAGNKFLAWNTSMGVTKELSPRERQVLAAIAEGFSNKQIASQMGVGVRTIETHRQRIMRKLKIRSIAGLTKFAVSKGLISLPPLQE
jgi:two-component system nitrate/nitrite response regulator NarL